MRTVKMHHPNLKGAQIEVSERAVAHHERAGWKRSDAADAAESRAAKTAAPVGPRPKSEENA